MAHRLFPLCLLLLAGCASLMSQATGRMAQDVASAILNQDDPETVRQGAPAYLLMVDGLVRGDPDSEALLLAGARLYGAYAGAFVDDPARASRLADKARAYARRALCLRLPDLCEASEEPYERFAALLPTVGAGDVDTVYGFASTWAGWVQANAGDWVAVADLPKVEAAIRRVVELDDAHDRGRAHLYLGVLATVLPPAMGGRVEEGRNHFEKAVELSGGRDLMAQVLFAQRYARLVFDRELHDRLLRGVLGADPREPDLTLSNVLAQAEAEKLLASAEDFF